VRIGMAQAALRMTASRPLFGVGVGEFYQRSGEFIAPDLAILFPPARNENAHNNFLQILAELGGVGLAAFLWVLGLSVRRLVALLAAPGDVLPVGLAVGLAAFGLSCLAGHPLLVPEVAGIFWLVLGVVAGMGRPASGAPDTRASIGTWVAAALLILAVSVPVRARQQVANSDMEHVGIGMLTGWRRTDDNLLYREAGAASRVFVPGEAGSITMPLRATRAGATMDVAIDLDGKPANVVHVEGDHWTSALVVLPTRSGGPRFRRLDLRVVSGENLPVEGAVLLVGKVIPH
jgi:O-Antigen ligase